MDRPSTNKAFKIQPQNFYAQTRTAPKVYVKPRVALLIALMMIAMLLTSCAETAVSATNAERETYRALHETLPTASTRDTAQTQKEILVHRTVFFDLCFELGHCKEAGDE